MFLDLKYYPVESFNYFYLENLLPDFLLFISILSLLFLKPIKKPTNSNYYFFELWKYSVIILSIYNFLKILQAQKSSTAIFFFNSFWFEDQFVIYVKILLIFCILITLSFSFFFLISINNNKKKVRILFFLLFTILFLFGLIMSFDLFGIYLSIEGLTLTLTILIASNLSRVSIETGLKYILLSAFTSCFLLLAIGFFLFFFGTTNLLALKVLTTFNTLPSNISFLFISNIKYLLLFFFLNLLFKLAAWPCCFWVPDIYNGLTLPNLFYFSTTIKLIFFLFFIRFFTFTFFSYYAFIKLLFIIIAVSTSLFGVIGSLFQNKLKLFIAFSGITHIGFIFFALSSFNYIGVFSAIFYLFFYIISIFLFFGLLLNINIIVYHKLWGIRKLPILYISDLKGIYLKQKTFGIYLILLFFFLAGVPPFISFFGKFWIYVTLFLNKQYFCVIFLFILSILSMFYYLWWIRSFIFDIDSKSSKIIYFSTLSYELVDQFYNKYFFCTSWLFSIKIIKFLFLGILFFLIIYSPLFLFYNVKVILLFSKKLFLILNII